jgi:hypothetical protein
VARQIVHHDDVAFRQSGDETFFHPFLKRRCIDWPVEGLLRHEAAKAQAGNQRKLRPRARSRRMARSGPATVHHRRQAEAARDQQARQQIPAQTADPWSTRGAALCGRTRHAARPMGERAHEPRPSKRRGRRLRQQAGPNRLGGVAARRTVHRPRNAGGGVEFGYRAQRVHRPTGVCERVTTGWPDSRTAFRKPGLKNGARRRVFYEDRSARISIMAGRRPFEAGYVEAD